MYKWLESKQNIAKRETFQTRIRIAMGHFQWSIAKFRKDFFQAVSNFGGMKAILRSILA